jgi:hypothetical protein
MYFRPITHFNHGIKNRRCAVSFRAMYSLNAAEPLRFSFPDAPVAKHSFWKSAAENPLPYQTL